VLGIAATVEEAFVKAQSEIANNVEIIERKEIATPKQTIVVVEDFDEQSARVQAKNQVGSYAKIKMIKLVTPGKQGILGIGKKPNRYEAEVFEQAVVEIIYKTKARILGNISNKLRPSPGDKGYCQMCGKSDTPFKILADRAFLLCSKNCEDIYGSLRVEALQHKNVSLTFNVSGMDISPLLESRERAYWSEAYCWFCGKTITMGAERCPSCGREPDVMLP
jgi:hypothetical protein